MNEQASPPAFSHSIEETFARILDFYGIRWEYEPHTFPLEWDAQGQPTIAFTPDFYLPDQNLYIELTTLRPKLSRYKNRKLRLMQTLYPEINVKLFKRKEMRELMLKFGLIDEVANLMNGEAQNKNQEER